MISELVCRRLEAHYGAAVLEAGYWNWMFLSIIESIQSEPIIIKPPRWNQLKNKKYGSKITLKQLTAAVTKSCSLHASTWGLSSLSTVSFTLYPIRLKLKVKFKLKVIRNKRDTPYRAWVLDKVPNSCCTTMTYVYSNSFGIIHCKTCDELA